MMFTLLQIAAIAALAAYLRYWRAEVCRRNAQSWDSRGRSDGAVAVSVNIPGAGGAILAGCMILTSRQLCFWKDSVTLFRHALDVTEDNWIAHTYLGFAL